MADFSAVAPAPLLGPSFDVGAGPFSCLSVENVALGFPLRHFIRLGLLPALLLWRWRLHRAMDSPIQLQICPWSLRNHLQKGPSRLVSWESQLDTEWASEAEKEHTQCWDFCFCFDLIFFFFSENVRWDGRSDDVGVCCLPICVRLLTCLLGDIVLCLWLVMGHLLRAIFNRRTWPHRTKHTHTQTHNNVHTLWCGLSYRQPAH